MHDDYDDRVRALTLEKALAVAAYGESVAASRYRTLAEKTMSQAHRKIFEEMAHEEQEHHVRVQELTRKYFSGSDFVLKPEDKDLVIVGPRLLEVNDGPALDRALTMIYESERLTGRFYAALHRLSSVRAAAGAAGPEAEFQPVLKEMADECFAHADRLKAIPPAA